MFGEGSCALELLNVIAYEDSGADSRHPSGQGYCALSYRLEAEDTRLIAEGETYFAAAGCVAFFPAGVPYRRQTRRDRLITFHFIAPGLAGLPLRVFSPEVGEPLAPLFRQALSVWDAREGGYRFRAQALLCEALAHLFFETSECPLSPLVSRAIACLRENAGNPDFSVSSLSCVTHVSGTYLRRLFRRETGLSPKQYLEEMRFSSAKSYLSAGFLSVSEVAEACGFSDAKNFSTAFRRRFGYPPSAQTYENL